MHTAISTTLSSITLIACAVVLSGCDVLAPTRDAEGLIVRTTVMPTTDAWVGDCFSFVDGSDLAYASVTPCSDAHTHVVIGRGTLSETKVAMGGGLRNAVTANCEPLYDAFVAAATGGTKPEQASIVSSEQKPGGLVTSYSCLATDSVAVAAG